MEDTYRVGHTPSHILDNGRDMRWVCPQTLFLIVLYIVMDLKKIGSGTQVKELRQALARSTEEN